MVCLYAPIILAISLTSVGPNSYLSICSEPGIDWVIDRSAVPYFRDIAGAFMTDVTRRLKSERRLPRQRVPEPTSELAWTYTRGIFSPVTISVFRAGLTEAPGSLLWHSSRRSTRDSPQIMV